ncbi:hypothetical protein BD413DRAFT_545404 [Trametes elegans]|nr:hypothetical protein BD413DRAFT_545404 [Trametes elegans]
MSALASIPQEVLEHIAFFAATDDLLGPPEGILGLLSADRRTHAALSVSSNPYLWSRIFAHKFDLSCAIWRLSSRQIGPVEICDEFKLRCTLLKRIRRRSDSLATSSALSPTHRDALRSILWMAYMMMLENEGKNDRQLREYARFDLWLKDFLFHPSGASLAAWSVKNDLWPPDGERSALALWLFWYMLKPDDYLTTGDDTAFRDASGILKLFALGAHQYPISNPVWNEFAPPSRARGASAIKHFGVSLRMAPPAPAPPAILAYLTLANKLSVSWDTIHYMKPPSTTPPSLSPSVCSAEWEGEWMRGLHLADTSRPLGAAVSGAFIPGSLEGVWEGLFTYTEFTAYAALLSGAPPTVLQRSLVAHHPHLWKIREHHLYASDEPGAQTVRPLPPGNPLRGYIPNGCQISEGSEGVELKEAGQQEPILYRSWASVDKTGAPPPGRLVDIFITGEGHSAWGQFNLVGRIRPCDGFISLSKEYVDGDRGRWLYRGYMVGNAQGNLSGRWRDTLSPSDVPGYEGCFVMSRRR